MLEYLENNNLPNEVESFESLEEQQLYNIWKKYNAKDSEVGIIDWVSKIRQYASHIYYKYNKNLLEFWAKRQNDWPTSGIWEKFGFEVIGQTEKSFHLKFEDQLSKDFIQGEIKSSLLERVFLGKDIIEFKKSLKIDPCLKEYFKNYEYFKSPGQMWAIRSFILSPQGSNLLTILPTGSGKTLVGFASSLIGTKRDNLSLMVVPTTALAIDMERRLRELLGSKSDNFAYYFDLDLAIKNEIKDNIKKGKQRLVFCSPEIALGDLNEILCFAAKNRILKNIIVDEAHILDAWGNDFRPDFYGFMYFRKTLKALADNKLKTLLLSATINSSSLEVIKFLMNEPLMIISAVNLRYEPEYWFKYVNNEEEKIDLIKKILRFSPKPLILYTSLKEDAIFLYGLLKNNEGYKRIDLFTGDTDSEERRKIIDSWQNNELDIIVATSAFGLGVDKENVRTIIHSCIPESLDRFYQEVGRSGRDGKPSISFTVFTDKDIDNAKILCSKRNITIEKAFDRWRAMRVNKIDLESEDIVVDIDTTTTKSKSDFDKQWNLNTLNIMARLGWISLEFIGNKKYLVKIVNPPLGFNEQLDSWEEFSEFREKEQLDSKKELDLLIDILKQNVEVSKQLFKIYKVENTIPLPNCGGCPICRKLGKKIKKKYLPEPFIEQKWVLDIANIKEKFDRLNLDISKPAFVFYDDWKTLINSNDFNYELQELIKEGFVEISCSDKWIEKIQSSLDDINNHYYYFSNITKRNPNEYLYVPRIIILDEIYDYIPEYLLDNYSYPIVIFAKNNILCSDRLDRIFKDVCDNGKDYNDFK